MESFLDDIENLDAEDIKNRISAISAQHHDWRTGECINMHAGKNVMSRKARQLLANAGLVDNGTSGGIGNRNPTGTQYIDQLESIAVVLLRKLLHGRFLEYRSMSGSIANGIALAALTQPGDTIIAVGKKHYGHYTYLKEGYPKHLGLSVEDIPFVGDSPEIDLDALKMKIERVNARLLVVGTSMFTFPVPLKEIRKIADKTEAKILYDGAHVLGLIAGGIFQDPLAEGADILTGSTQKTFPGPIGGLLACNNEEIGAKVSRIMSSLFSNYCNNRVAALAMSAAEMIRFGGDYAGQVVKNAIALAEVLDEEGLPVLHQEKGYTASHQVLLDAKLIGGAEKVAKSLERVNLICTRFFLSSDDPSLTRSPNGVRLGVSAVTRLGMKEQEMKKIAHFIRCAIRHPEQVDDIRRKVMKMIADFPLVHCSFDYGI